MSKLEEKNMKILVTTPTGNIGRRVLVELLAPEFSVRVISRDPSRLPEEIREQVEVVRGSTDETATLRRALDGVEALFWCVPSASLDTMNVREHYERFAHAACQAIREARTSRIVTISAGGKRLAGNAGPISGLHAMEDILNWLRTISFAIWFVPAQACTMPADSARCFPSWRLASHAPSREPLNPLRQQLSWPGLKGNSCLSSSRLVTRQKKQCPRPHVEPDESNKMSW